ncbi:MAG: bacterioferritin [Planctomycetota bacterium]
MKGSPELIAKLDELLAEELTAINQYMVHSEMCANWGYDRLHDRIEKRAFQEMKHAEKLIQRILFLEAQPTVSKLNPIHVGSDVPKQFRSDLDSEMNAVRMYNEAILLADQVKDGATRQILESILNDEDDHVDWLEEQLDQIEQMGPQLYLSTQTSGG